MWRTYIIRFTGISYPEPKRYRPDMAILWADFGLSIAAVGDDLLCPPSAQRISEYYFYFFLVWGWLWGGGGGGGRRRIRRKRKALLHFSFFSFQLVSLSIQPGLKDWPKVLHNIVFLQNFFWLLGKTCSKGTERWKGSGSFLWIFLFRFCSLVS